jgi:hypothetical protein
MGTIMPLDGDICQEKKEEGGTEKSRNEELGIKRGKGDKTTTETLCVFLIPNSYFLIFLLTLKSIYFFVIL